MKVLMLTAFINHLYEALENVLRGIILATGKMTDHTTNKVFPIFSFYGFATGAQGMKGTKKTTRKRALRNNGLLLEKVTAKTK